MEYIATFHEKSLGVNLERAVLRGPAFSKSKGVEVAVVRSISNSNRRDKSSIKMVQVGDFVVSVNGTSAVGPGFPAVCKMITSASRPISVGFQRLEKAIKSDFRKASKGDLLRKIGRLSKSVAKLHERRDDLRERTRALEPQKDTMLRDVKGLDEAIDELAAQRAQGCEAQHELRAITDRVVALTAQKKRLVVELKALHKQLRSKQSSHDLVFFASVGAQRALQTAPSVTGDASTLYTLLSDEGADGAVVLGESAGSSGSRPDSTGDRHVPSAGSGAGAGAGGGVGSNGSSGAGSGGGDDRSSELGSTPDGDSVPGTLPQPPHTAPAVAGIAAPSTPASTTHTARSVLPRGTPRSIASGTPRPWTPRELQTFQCVVKLHSRLSSARRRVHQRRVVQSGGGDGPPPSPSRKSKKPRDVAAKVRVQAMQLAKTLKGASTTGGDELTRRALKVALLMVEQNARLHTLLEHVRGDSGVQ